MKALSIFTATLCLVGLSQFASANSNEKTAAPDTFERAARREAARQGWPGYPDSYQDAFLAGARWANGRKKAMTCTDSFASEAATIE